jgi:hypothetical protein
MTMLATLALASLVAAQAATAPAPAAKIVPMTVQVEAAAGASADAGAQAWVKELRSALEARKGEFRLPKKTETAELVVRIDSLAKGQNDSHVMNGALLMGKATHSFNLSYPGDVAPQAEKLARNLRKLADQMKAAPAAR